MTSANDFTVKAGPAYQLPFWRVQPRVRLGVTGSMLWHGVREGGKPKPETIGMMYLGKYFGLGAVIPCARGALLADVEYADCGYSDFDITKLSFTVGYQF